MEDNTTLDQLVYVLRTQKHDVLNHMQVIQGFLQLNKLDLAQKYLSQAIGEIQEKNSQLKIQSPNLVALLSIYRERFERQGISFQVVLTDNMWEKSEWDSHLTPILQEIFILLAGDEYYPQAKITVQLMQIRGEKSCQVILYNLMAAPVDWQQQLIDIKKQNILSLQMDKSEEEQLIMFKIY